MSKRISWFKEVTLNDVPSVGGKGASLGELENAGIGVPPGFVITTEAFISHMSKLDPDGTIMKTIAAIDLGDAKRIEDETESIRRAIDGSMLDDAFASELVAAYQALGGETDMPVAIRSSATSEDSSDASFAGLQDTYLWMRGIEQIKEALLKCWSSLYSVPSVTYRRRLNLPENEVAMAVVVQKMVDPSCAGVMFTRSPTTGDRSVISIEAAWGLGSSLVSGEVTPDKVTVNKITGEILNHVVSIKTIRHVPIPAGGVDVTDVPGDMQEASCLSPEDIKTLCVVAKRAEKLYRCPVDIEWAIERREGEAAQVYLLQSRPETVWSTKEKARSEEKLTGPALNHVFSIYSGKKI